MPYISYAKIDLGRLRVGYLI